MTTATEYALKAAELRELTRLLMPVTDERCTAKGVTRREVLNELHERAILDYAASSQGLDALVVALGHAVTGRLAGFTGAKLIRALGVLADQADAQDWEVLGVAGLTQRMIGDSLHELATREVTA